MPSGNIWDNSNILLSNQAGANWARGIEQVGRAFGKGIEAYYEHKQRLEKEEATVDWLNQNEGAVNQLFPQLAQVKDPAERKKVIKAGIKGAGLENLVQVRQFMETQRRQQQMEGIQQEMANVQLAGAKLHNQNAQELMEDRRMESRAIQAAGMADPNGDLDPSEIYMRSGGRSPQMIAAMTKSRPFSPAEFMTPSGLNMVQTSPNSFIPDPRVRQKPGKAEAYAGGPEYSKDKKYFRSGPDDAWKPVRASSAGKMDPVQLAELNALPGEIAALEKKITDAAGEVRKGNKKPGPDWMPGFDGYDDRVKKLQTDLDAKKKRLRELNRLSSAGGADEEEEEEQTPTTIGDPFSYVLGGN